jgi:DNA primase
MLQRDDKKQAFDEHYSGDQVSRVLKACGIKIVQEQDDWLNIFCPYHNNFRTRSGGVNKDSGKFNCFSCGETHSLTELVMHVTGRTYFEAIRLIDSKKDNDSIISFLDKTLKKEPEFKEFDIETINRLHDNLMLNERAIGYLKNRSITKQSAEKFKLGYSDKQDMVTIPIYSPDDVCIGFVGRSIEGKDFKNTVGLQRSKTLFNLNRSKRHDGVFVVESSFDAILLDQVGANAVATLGATISTKQIELIQKYFNKVFVIGDNDDAGKEMARKIVERLPNIAININLPDRYKDISDIEKEKLTEYISKIDNHILVGI